LFDDWLIAITTLRVVLRRNRAVGCKCIYRHQNANNDDATSQFIHGDLLGNASTSDTNNEPADTKYAVGTFIIYLLYLPGATIGTSINDTRCIVSKICTSDSPLVLARLARHRPHSVNQIVREPARSHRAKPNHLRFCGDVENAALAAEVETPNIFVAKKIVTMERNNPEAQAVVGNASCGRLVGQREGEFGDRPQAGPDFQKTKLCCPASSNTCIRCWVRLLITEVIANEDWELPGKTLRRPHQRISLRPQILRWATPRMVAFVG
jgi:hypothetical protein